MTQTISDTFVTASGPTNGAKVTGYLASRFSTPPEINSPPPGSYGSDTITVTTGTEFGGPGQFRLPMTSGADRTPTNEPFYVSFDYNGQISWKYYSNVNAEDGGRGSIGIYGTLNGHGYQAKNFQPGTQPSDLATVSQIAPGPQGTAGVDGLTGPQGVQGAQGYQGYQGAFGGPQGYQGNQGTQGAQGFQGNQGAGTQGVQGAQGFQGTTGAGTQGVQGAQGFQGTQGVQGYQGTQGNNGNIGPAGLQGSQGPQGITGATGAQGSQGNQGFQGTQGNQGFQGPTDVVTSSSAPSNTNVLWLDTSATGNGTQGPQGSQGYQGLQGISGSQGFQGNQGNQGAQGSTGAQGTTGSQGPQGSQGNQGNQGNQGLTGPQGTATSNTGAFNYSGSAAVTLSTTASTFTTVYTPPAISGFTNYMITFLGIQTTPCSTTGQVFARLSTSSGATITNPTSFYRVGNAATSGNTFGTASITWYATFSGTSSSSIYIEMAHANTQTTAATYNYFTVTVVGLN